MGKAEVQDFVGLNSLASGLGLRDFVPVRQKHLL